MKKIALLLVATVTLSLCVTLPLSAAEARDPSPELSVDVLNARLEALEKRQASNARVLQGALAARQSMAPKEEAKIERGGLGGYAKFYLFDKTVGERGGKASSSNSSAGLSDFIIFYSRVLSDWLSVNVDTQFTITASATPGKSALPGIARSAAATLSTKIYQANVTVSLPHDMEMRLGSFLPLFSESYARALWWNEQFHEQPGLTFAESWYDAGVEIYRNFDIGKVSMPAYLYVLNGPSIGTGYAPQYADNNENKTLMLHVAPELFGGKLRLPVSAATGKWDDGSKYDVTRTNVGFDLLYHQWNFASEYAVQSYQQIPLGGAFGSADGQRWSYFVKGAYRFSPKYRLVAKFAHAELYKTGAAAMRYTDFDEMSVALGYYLARNSVVQLQCIHGLQEVSDGSDKTDYDRLTLGLRTTFTVF
ncbi:MAG: hypothetical protein ACYC5N_00880 [Endomicrobiales bacterium]